jgi:integrase
MAVRSHTDDKGRRRFTVEFQQGGQRILKRLPAGCTAAQAQEWETNARREIFAQGELGHKPEVLLSEVIQGWLATKPHTDHRNLVNKANQLAPFVEGRGVSEAMTAASEALSSWSGLALATRQRRLAVLKASLHWAFDQGLTSENLSARIKLRKERNEREVFLTREQVRALAKASEYGEAIIIAAYTGLRAAELLSLSRDSIRAGSLHVLGKGKRFRVVPVAKPASRALAAVPFGITYWQLAKEFRRACTAVGLGPEVTFHVLRHTFASWMINAGTDVLTLAKLMGHSSTQVTARYAHLYQDTLKQAVGRLK